MSKLLLLEGIAIKAVPKNSTIGSRRLKGTLDKTEPKNLISIAIYPVFCNKIYGIFNYHPNAVKILIIKPSSLGDVIHALRVVNQIVDNISSVSIDWVIKAELEPILSASGLTQTNFLYQRGGGIRSYLALLRKVRKKKYDFVLDLQGLFRSAFLAFCTHSNNKMGVADGRECSTFFYKSVGECSRKTEIHAIDRLVPFLSQLNIQNWNPKLPTEFPNSRLSPSTLGHIGEKEFILLFPESRRQEKVWPHFAKLCQLLCKTSELNIVIGGNNEDGQYPEAIDLRNRLNLIELPVLIKRSSVVVTNDSAPLHIASSLNKPIVALFGPTSANRYGPYPLESENSTTFSAQEKNLDLISVEQVAEAVECAFNKREH